MWRPQPFIGNSNINYLFDYEQYLFVEAIEEEKQEMLMSELMRVSQLPVVELDNVLQ